MVGDLSRALMATTSQAASDGWPTPSRACQACAPSLSMVVACGDAGLPDLCALNFHTRDRGLCIWEFDHLTTTARDSEVSLDEALRSWSSPQMLTGCARKASMMASSC
jgi:hypothetical protein